MQWQRGHPIALLVRGRRYEEDKGHIQYNGLDSDSRTRSGRVVNGTSFIFVILHL